MDVALYHPFQAFRISDFREGSVISRTLQGECEVSYVDGIDGNVHVNASLGVFRLGSFCGKSLIR